MYNGMTFVPGCLHGYASAAKYLESCKPWRGETGKHDERPIKARRNRRAGVRRMHDDSIAFRLHDTDVVVYRPDNSVTINVYDSVTTADFIRCYAPYSVTASLSGRGAGYISVNGRCYRANHGDRITIYADGSVDASSHWVWPRVDRKAANAFRRSAKLDKVRAFLKAAETLGMPVKPPSYRDLAKHVAEILPHPDRWHMLLQLGGMKGLEMYERMYLRNNCLIINRHEYLSDWREVSRCRSACRTWGC